MALTRAKKEASIRTIKIDIKTMNAYRGLFETLTPNIYGLVFYSPDSKYKVISNTNANKFLRNTLQELGIDPITVRGLRHTHASVLLYKKVDINYVREQLGHCNIETTYKYYSHVIKELREEEEKQSIDTFENLYAQLKSKWLWFMIYEKSVLKHQRQHQLTAVLVWLI